MNSTTVTTPNELEIRVERIFDAPRAHVFSVWTDPKLIPEWWGDGTEVEEMDVRPGGTVAVVGDGAVGLSGVLAAKRLGAERIIALSRHADRQALAQEFGATDIVEQRGEEAIAAVLGLTGGVGADATLECVGTGQAFETAIAVARPGSMIGYVGVPHGVELPVGRMFRKNIGLAGGMAPVRRYLPDLLALVEQGRIDPGKVFDLNLPMDRVAEGYAAMDERRAIKVALTPVS